MRYLFAAITMFFMLVTTSATANTPDDLFDGILRDHVNQGVVDYPAISQDKRFQEYLNYLAVTDPKTFDSREEKLTFWINAYNALSIKGILDGLSPNSFFGRISFFKTTDYPLAGRGIDLYELERDIIIPFGEPRIHFAIVCASASCPTLKSEVYRAETLDKQLEDATIQFMNNTDKNQFDAKLRIARLSMIFDWFDKDFEKHAGSVARYVKTYISDAEAIRVLSAKDVYIRHLDYDWSLNGIPIK